MSEVLLQDSVQLSAEALLQDGVQRSADAVLQSAPELLQGSSSTVIGLAVGLGLSVIVILGFVGFGYLLYRVSR